MYVPLCLDKIFRFTVFRLLEKVFLKLPISWHDLIIDSTMQNKLPINLPKNVCALNAKEIFFQKKVPFSVSTMPMLCWKILWGYVLRQYFVFNYFIQSRGFLSVAYLTVGNLALLGIQVHCQVSVRSQYLVRLLFQCWITGGHIIHPPIDGLLPPTDIEPTPFRNSASKVAGLQVHATTLVNICKVVD